LNCWELVTLLFECKLPRSELCFTVNFIIALSSALFIVIVSFLMGIVTVADIEICALLGYYTVYSGNSLPMFWDNLSVPFSSSHPPGFLDP